MIKDVCHILSMIALTSAAMGIYACEPAALNWQQLYQDYDTNQNTLIEKSEWKKLIELKNQPYQWSEKIQKDDPFRLNTFKRLDLNKDQVLNEDEMTQIYLYLPNPCDGWGDTWGVAEEPMQWWEKLFNRF